jgi:hypothetical protein
MPYDKKLLETDHPHVYQLGITASKRIRYLS